MSQQHTSSFLVFFGKRYLSVLDATQGKKLAESVQRLRMELSQLRIILLTSFLLEESTHGILLFSIIRPLLTSNVNSMVLSIQSNSRLHNFEQQHSIVFKTRGHIVFVRAIFIGISSPFFSKSISRSILVLHVEMKKQFRMF